MLIPVQDENPNVYFANPADVARSLVLARNWTPTIVQELTNVSAELRNCVRNLKKTQKELENLESDVLSKVGKLTVADAKTNLTLRAFIKKVGTEEQLKKLREIESKITSLEDALVDLENTYETLEKMQWALIKSTEWLSHYINWFKFELRELG